MFCVLMFSMVYDLLSDVVYPITAAKVVIGGLTTFAMGVLIWDVIQCYKDKDSKEDIDLEHTVDPREPKFY